MHISPEFLQDLDDFKKLIAMIHIPAADKKQRERFEILGNSLALLMGSLKKVEKARDVEDILKQFSLLEHGVLLYQLKKISGFVKENLMSLIIGTQTATASYLGIRILFNFFDGKYNSKNNEDLCSLLNEEFSRFKQESPIIEAGFQTKLRTVLDQINRFIDKTEKIPQAIQTIYAAHCQNMQTEITALVKEQMYFQAQHTELEKQDPSLMPLSVAEITDLLTSSTLLIKEKFKFDPNTKYKAIDEFELALDSIINKAVIYAGLQTERKAAMSALNQRDQANQGFLTIIVNLLIYRWTITNLGDEFSANAEQLNQLLESNNKHDNSVINDIFKIFMILKNHTIQLPIQFSEILLCKYFEENIFAPALWVCAFMEALLDLNNIEQQMNIAIAAYLNPSKLRIQQILQQKAATIIRKLEACPDITAVENLFSEIASLFPTFADNEWDAYAQSLRQQCYIVYHKQRESFVSQNLQILKSELMANTKLFDSLEQELEKNKVELAAKTEWVKANQKLNYMSVQIEKMHKALNQFQTEILKQFENCQKKGVSVELDCIQPYFNATAWNNFHNELITIIRNPNQRKLFNFIEKTRLALQTTFQLQLKPLLSKMLSENEIQVYEETITKLAALIDSQENQLTQLKERLQKNKKDITILLRSELIAVANSVRNLLCEIRNISFSTTEFNANSVLSIQTERQQFQTALENCNTTEIELTQRLQDITTIIDDLESFVQMDTMSLKTLIQSITDNFSKIQFYQTVYQGLLSAIKNDCKSIEELDKLQIELINQQKELSEKSYDNFTLENLIPELDFLIRVRDNILAINQIRINHNSALPKYLLDFKSNLMPQSAVLKQELDIKLDQLTEFAFIACFTSLTHSSDKQLVSLLHKLMRHSLMPNINLQLLENILLKISQIAQPDDMSKNDFNLRQKQLARAAVNFIIPSCVDTKYLTQLQNRLTKENCEGNKPFSFLRYERGFFRFNSHGNTKTWCDINNVIQKQIRELAPTTPSRNFRRAIF